MEPLDRRIAKALAERVSIAEAETVHALAVADQRRLEGEADALDTAALSPALELVEAQAKHAEAADRRFHADRLDAACSALRSRIAELRDAGIAEAQASKAADALDARDALARDIAARYPAIVRELTSLVKRISENNVLCASAGVPAVAEAMGRGIPASFYIPGLGTCSTISAAMLPMPSQPFFAWEAHGLSGAMGFRGLNA